MITEHRQKAELPHHRYQGATHDQQCAAQATGIPIEDNSRDGDRRSEEQQYLLQAVDKVANNLGKTGDADLDTVTLVLTA
ncbi:hypothetical protein D3C85_1301670 [compost metagenome]